MASMNAFNSSAFQTVALTGAVEKLDYKPSMLGEMNIFQPLPVRDKNLFVDRRDGKLTIIPTSETGAPPSQLEKDTRDAVPLRAIRLSKGFRMTATEVQGIRAFNSESELMSIQTEFLRNMSRIRQDMELTHEFHRLAALQGRLLNADGQEIYNYFTQFGESEAPSISFALGTASTDVRKKCMEVTRGMARSARGSFTTQTTVHSIAGDNFFDKLISHPNVKETYLNHQAAADLRENKAFGSFTYGGITFHNYRGTDDNSAVAIPPDEARFFPIGAQDVFKKAMAPHETFEYVNTPGRDMYAMTVRDMERDMYVDGELYSYPLYFCQQPRVLRKATAT